LCFDGRLIVVSRTIVKTVIAALALSSGMITVAAWKQTARRNESPVVVQAVAPFFNPIAAAGLAHGDVTAKVQINKEGRVTSVDIESGQRPLYESVEYAASRWEFAPSKDEGIRTATLTFEFDFVTRSHGNYRPEELTPVFVPPYKVIVVRDMSGKWK
jgi:TonB family protein